jgi:Spy/CpxP family protein refolding chaperone
MNFKVSTRTLLIAGVLTLGGAATAFAVAPTDGERCGPGRGMHGMSHGMQHGMPGMARLHGDLKLDAKQEALWQEAEKSAKENTSGMREQMRKQREAALETLKQPGADLRAVMKQMDDARDAGRKQHEASRDRWLAAYDSLNAEQKEKARLFFKDKLERMERFGKGGRGRG